MENWPNRFARDTNVFVFTWLMGNNESPKHGDNIEFYETISSCSVIVFPVLNLFIKMSK